MKKRLSLLLVLVLAVFVIASVGYAAWYITRDPKNVEVSNVDAYEVDTDEITVRLSNAAGTAEDDTQRITFGYVHGADNNANGVWLQYGAGDLEENLSVYVQITAGKAGVYQISAALEKSAAAAPTTLFINTPSFEVQGTPTNATLDNTTIEFTDAGSIVIKVTYSWPEWETGVHTNPFTYFNGKSKNVELSADERTAANAILDTDLAEHATWKDYAKNYLTDLDTYCDANLRFKITVTD